MIILRKISDMMKAMPSLTHGIQAKVHPESGVWIFVAEPFELVQLLNKQPTNFTANLSEGGGIHIKRAVIIN
jgi:hypothetical protein